MYFNITRQLIATTLLLLSLGVNAAPSDLSIEDFARFPEFRSVQISPTGEYLAVTMPDEGQTGLHIIDISDPEKGFQSMSAYRFPRLTHVFNVYWASDDRVVFETTRELDLVGDIVPRRTGMIYAMDADGSNKLLIQGSNRRWDRTWGFVVDELPDDPDHVLIYRKRYGLNGLRAIKLNIHDGSDELLAENPFEDTTMQGQGFVIDGEANVRLAYRFDAMDESLDIARRLGDGEWKKYHFEKQESFSPLGYLPDGETLVIHNNGSPLGYMSFDLESGEATPLLTHDTVTAQHSIRASDGRSVIGASFEDGKPEHRFILPDHPDAKLQQMLDSAFNGLHADITSRTRDGRLAVVAVRADRLPTDYYLFDTETNKAEFLLASQQWIDPAQLAERRPFSIEARDGAEIHGYITLPKGKEPSKLPTVVVIHGGPHGPRDYWEYDYQAQLLASRGYAVVQTNFRGSGGYGKDYEEAGYLRWGTRIQDDIEDGIRWAIDQGIADEDRLCVYGASFGGYSVLAQLTRNDLFKCGFAFVGVYDMDLMMESGDIQRRDEGVAYLERVLGTDPKARHDQSPIHFVDQIDAALYVAHGQEDDRAHASHYYTLLEALDEAGIPHQTMLKHHEGHGFYDMENRVELYSEMLEFFEEHIGN